MRTLLVSAGLFIALAGTAAADPPGAQAAYAERRALLTADSQCRLFTPELRGALQAGAGQARGALLRAGWTSARLAELDAAAVNAARGRSCNDERTLAAAERARQSFSAWTRTMAMDFPGAFRTWTARRIEDSAGWRIVQHARSPRAASFGVQQNSVSLTLPLAAAARAPASAELVIRDIDRARILLFDVPGRQAQGLENGAPSLATARRFRASARQIETIAGQRRVRFDFPNETLNAITALDPRETLIVNVDGDRILFEVGDFAAARAFLAARAAS